MKNLRKCCAFALQQQERSARSSDVSSSPFVVLGWDFCFEARELGDTELLFDWGCDWGFDWGYGAGHVNCDVPFENQYVCLSFYHHCHGRKVISSICLLAFGLYWGNENEIWSQHSAEKMNCVDDVEVRMCGEG